MPPRWTTPVRNLIPLTVGLGLALGLHFLFGAIDQPFYAKLVTDIGIAIVLAVSLNMVNGFTGQFSMGHAGFMAVGGYAAAAITYYASIRVFGTSRPFEGANPAGGILSWSLDMTPKVTDANGVTSGSMPLGLSLLDTGDLLFVFACVVGGLVAAAAGYVVGLPSLRLRGDYLAIVTLGFGEIVRVLFQSSREQIKPTGRVEQTHRIAEILTDPATNAPVTIVEAGTNAHLAFGPGDRIVTDAASGAQNYIDVIPGLEYIQHASPLDLATRLGKATGFNSLPMYTSLFWTYLVVAITLVIAFRLKYSSSGRAFLSIREDEVAAAAMGINTTRYKVRAFVLASFFAGVAGALFAHQNGSINAGGLGFIRSFDVIIMIVLGGLGSISGTILAAVVLTILPELLRNPPTLFSWPGLVVVAAAVGLTVAFSARRLRAVLTVLGVFAGWEIVRRVALWQHINLADYRMLAYALLLILMMILRPQGLMGIHEIWETAPLRRLMGIMRSKPGGVAGGRAAKAGGAA